jgi:hypothetical protein
MKHLYRLNAFLFAAAFLAAAASPLRADAPPAASSFVSSSSSAADVALQGNLAVAQSIFAAQSISTGYAALGTRVFPAQLFLVLRRHPVFKRGWWSIASPIEIPSENPEQTGWIEFPFEFPGQSAQHTYYFKSSGAPDWICGLYSDVGSDIAANKQNHAQLLAEMIPALTWPAGSSKVQKIAEEKNYNMPEVHAANTDKWPRSKNANETLPWKHGDVRDLAYFFNYPLYNEIVKISEK